MSNRTTEVAMLLSIVLCIALSTVDSIQPPIPVTPPPAPPTQIELPEPIPFDKCPVTPYVPGAGEDYVNCVRRMNLVV